MGSRDPNGNVPNVNWNPDNAKLNVNWYNPNNRNDNLRSRPKFLAARRGKSSPQLLSRYLIQPFVILEISSSSAESVKYFLSLTILISFSKRIRFFITSIFILKRSSRNISDHNLIWLLKIIIKSFEKKKNKGLPLGNVTSQLFANVYLNELDRYRGLIFWDMYHFRIIECCAQKQKEEYFRS